MLQCQKKKPTNQQFSSFEFGSLDIVSDFGFPIFAHGAENLQSKPLDLLMRFLDRPQKIKVLAIING